MTTYNKDIPLTNGFVFRSQIEGERTPEVYGWVEKNHSIVHQTSGFYRTDDAQKAARIAASNIGEQVA